MGISSSKTFFIITNKESEVKNYIMNEMDSNITIIKSKGGNSTNENIIVCIVSTKEYDEVKKGVLNIDSDALILITDAYEAFNV